MGQALPNHHVKIEQSDTDTLLRFAADARADYSHPEQPAHSPAMRRFHTVSDC
jgi:hypothetical protein